MKVNHSKAIYYADNDEHKNVLHFCLTWYACSPLVWFQTTLFLALLVFESAPCCSQKTSVTKELRKFNTIKNYHQHTNYNDIIK